MADDRNENEPSPPPRAPGEGVRIIGAEEAAAREAEISGRLPQDQPRFGDVPVQPAGPRPAVRFPLPEDAGATSRPATTELPHWTEPPTGEVPRILPGDGDEADDDTEAWSGLNRGPRWRVEQSDWDEGDFEDSGLLEDQGTRMGALDENRSTRSDLFSFDDEVEDDGELELTPAARPTRPRTTRIGTRTKPPEPEFGFAPQRGGGGGGDRDIAVAVGVGVVVAAIALLCFAAGPAAAAALATVIVVLAAVEAFDIVRRTGTQPATLLGLVATGAVMVGAYTKGERALPLIIALTVIFSMLWYLGGVVKARPAISVGSTLLAFCWVGVLGSFATLMLRYPDREGVAFLLGAVLTTVANDVGGLFFGKQWGRTPLAPEISPNKTLEGLFGASIASVLVALVVVRAVHPWDFGSALVLGLVVSVVAPLGDLCQSMIKRDVGVKDTGTLLPGHGGILDRFDALLFVLPAVYYLVELLDLAGK
jgi:phosphatidate cytidylyltransferase